MEQSQPTPQGIKKKSKMRLWISASLVVVVLIGAGIGVIFIFDLGHQSGPPPNAPQGAFIGTPQRQADGYKLTFGVITPVTKFVDCRVVLSVNGIHQAAQTIGITNGNVFAANNITWTDLNDNGDIDKNDSLVVSDSISTVSYTVTIISVNYDSSICSQSWIVP